MLGLQTESMGSRILSVDSRRSADWLCPHEPSRSRVGSLDKLSDVLPGILVSARTGRNAQVVLQLVYSRFRLGQIEEPAGAMRSFQLLQHLLTRGCTRMSLDLSVIMSRARHSWTLHHHWRQTTRPKQRTAWCAPSHQRRPSLENAQKGSLHQSSCSERADQMCPSPSHGPPGALCGSFRLCRCS